MAAIAVTTANSNSLPNAARIVLRNSSGHPIVVYKQSDTTIALIKANTANPTSFADWDSGLTYTTNTIVCGISAAIDSSDIIHLSWIDDIGASSDLKYATCSAVADLTSFSAVVLNSDIGSDPTITSLFTAIAIDSNNIPHIACTLYPSISGGSTYTVDYYNRIGGAWSTVVSPIKTKNIHSSFFSLAIDKNNIPVISVNRNATEVYALIGNGNNATAFTLQSVATANTVGTSIAVDYDGNHWIAFTNSSGYISLIKHNVGDAWSTWQTAITNSNAGANPSLCIINTDVYVFYEDENNDIVYDSWDGSQWTGETVLETGTFNTVVAKWAFWADNDSLGKLEIKQSSVFSTIYIQGSGGTSEAVGLKFDSVFPQGRTIKSFRAILNKYGTPTDNFLCKVRSGSFTGTVLATATLTAAQITAGGTTWHGWVFDTAISVSSGTSVYYFTFERSGSRDATNYFAIRNSAVNTYSGIVYATASSGAWTENVSGYEIPFSIKFEQNELDYIFLDETATPDVWWNTLTFAAPTTWLTKSLKWYNGSSWVAKPLKVYSGGSWATKSLKRNM
jgi:hypothetical protein